MIILHRKSCELFYKALLLLCGICCLALMSSIVALVIRFGVKELFVQLTSFLNCTTSSTSGLLSQIVNTLIICFLSVMLAMPAGILCAVYLVFYGRGGRVAAIIETMLGGLMAIPSAVYGLFGFFLFSQLFRLRYSVIAGILTMAIMLFSVAASSAYTALNAVDRNLTSAALALGATKFETIFDVLFLTAKSGLISAAVLCVARTAGESAALLLTSGVGNAMPTEGWLRYFISSGATLAVGLYQSVLEGEISSAFGSALILLIFIGICSLLSQILERNKGGG